MPTLPQRQQSPRRGWGLCVPAWEVVQTCAGQSQTAGVQASGLLPDLCPGQSSLRESSWTLEGQCDTAVRKDNVWAGLVTGVLEDMQLLEQVRGCRGFEETVWLGMGDQRAWAEGWGPGMTCLLAKPIVWIGGFRLKLHGGGCLLGGGLSGLGYGPDRHTLSGRGREGFLEEVFLVGSPRGNDCLL